MLDIERLLDRYFFVMYVFCVVALGLSPLIGPILGFIFKPEYGPWFLFFLLLYLFIGPIEVALWADMPDTKRLMWDD